MSSKICQVCTEKYNNTTRKRIICDCEYECCRACFKTYMLSNKEYPGCMSCKKTFTREFLAKNLEKTFMNNEYKRLKEDILYEEEKLLFPFTQEYIRKEDKIK